MISTSGRHRLCVVLALTLLWSLAGPIEGASATPGWANGEYLWFKPGALPTNGSLKTYVNSSVYYTMTAGSGDGTGDECISNHGRLPTGWYSGAHEYHIHNKDNTIKGRVWGLTNKACYDGTIRTELYIHTEETKTNGQSCPTGGDDPYCWENADDYKSIGCVKLSYPAAGFPNSVNTLNTWWHTNAGGAASTYYYKWLYVGSSAPAPPPA